MVFSGILWPSEGGSLCRKLKLGIWKTPFGKHRLEPFGTLVARAIRNAIRANRFATKTPIFIARQADSHKSLEFPIRANHPIRANRFANHATKFGTTPTSGKALSEWKGHSRSSGRFPGHSRSSSQNSETCDPEVALQTPKPRKIQRHEKVTQKWLSGSRWMWLKSYSKVTQKLLFRPFLSLLSHFWVTFESDSPGPRKSLLSHFFVSLNFSGFGGL